jgi:hypothetical protein
LRIKEQETGLTLHEHDDDDDDDDDRQCTYNVTLRHVRATIVAVGNQYYIFQECVFVALGTQTEMRMCHFIACINGTILERKNLIEYQMCFVILSTTFVWNIFHSKKN